MKSGLPDAVVSATVDGVITNRVRVTKAPLGQSERKARGYQIITISIYNEDASRLDAMVRELRRRGWSGASKSALIRLALRGLDETSLDQIVSRKKASR